VRVIIVIKNIVQLEWEITGSTEEFMLSLESPELERYLERKYGELKYDLVRATDASITFLDAEVEVYDTPE
jgi:hypothetical protein